MILVVTPRLNDSPHIRREVERAVSNKIPIIPLIVEQTKFAKWVQYYISAHQWVDATNKSLIKKAMLDISDKISKVVLLPKEDELEILNGEKSDAIESDSHVQEDIDLVVSNGWRKQNWIWICLSLIILAGVFYLIKSNESSVINSVHVKGVSEQNSLNIQIPEMEPISNRGLIASIHELTDEVLVVKYVEGDFLNIRIIDSDLCSFASIILSEDSIQDLMLTSIAGESMQGLACGVVSRSDGSNGNQESIGIYEFDIEGEFRCISTLDYGIFGDSIVKVSPGGFLQDGSETFSLISIVEASDQDSLVAVVTRVTRDGIFLSNKILMYLPSDTRVFCGMISVENGNIAVVANRQENYETSETIIWIDSTNCVRNMYLLETEGIGMLASIVESNIHGVLLKFSSMGGLRNGSMEFVWLDETGDYVKSLTYDTAQQTLPFGGLADLQNGDYLCSIDNTGGVIQGNIDTELFQFSPFLLDSIKQNYQFSL